MEQRKIDFADKLMVCWPVEKGCSVSKVWISFLLIAMAVCPSSIAMAVSHQTCQLGIEHVEFKYEERSDSIDNKPLSKVDFSSSAAGKNDQYSHMMGDLILPFIQKEKRLLFQCTPQQSIDGLTFQIYRSPSYDLQLTCSESQHYFTRPNFNFDLKPIPS